MDHNKPTEVVNLTEDSSSPESVERQAQEWHAIWSAEVDRRRKVEKTLGSVSWRRMPGIPFDQLPPLVRKRVLEMDD